MQTDLRHAYRLEYLTIGWNAAEAVIALTFGILAGSLALTAFGIDSVIEVFSAVVVLFELRGHGDHDPDGHYQHDRHRGLPTSGLCRECVVPKAPRP